MFHCEVLLDGWAIVSRHGIETMMQTVTQITWIDGVLCRLVVELEYFYVPAVHAAWVESDTSPGAGLVSFMYAYPLDPDTIVLHAPRSEETVVSESSVPEGASHVSV